MHHRVQARAASIMGLAHMEPVCMLNTVIASRNYSVVRPLRGHDTVKSTLVDNKKMPPLASDSNIVIRSSFPSRRLQIYTWCPHFQNCQHGCDTPQHHAQAHCFQKSTPSRQCCCRWRWRPSFAANQQIILETAMRRGFWLATSWQGHRQP